VRVTKTSGDSVVGLLSHFIANLSLLLATMGSLKLRRRCVTVVLDTECDPIITDEVLDVPLSRTKNMFKIGVFRVSDCRTVTECIAIYVGLPPSVAGEGNAIPARIHSGCVTSEVFGSDRCDCAWQLRHALDLFEKRRVGVLVYLPGQEGRGIGLLNKLRAFRLQDGGTTIADAWSVLGLSQDPRDYRPAVAVMKRLGVTQVELITNNPQKLKCAEVEGLQIVRRIPTVMQPAPEHIQRYLESKRDQFGHLI